MLQVGHPVAGLDTRLVKSSEAGESKGWMAVAQMSTVSVSTTAMILKNKARELYHTEDKRPKHKKWPRLEEEEF